MRTPAWTTPVLIRDLLWRRWMHGDLLRAELGEPLYPLSLPIRRPTTKELSERFADVRDWIAALEAGSRARRGFGYDIAWDEINHRVLGTNRIPARVSVPTGNDALRLIGMRRDAARFRDQAQATLVAFPALRDWVERRPLMLVEHADAWNRIVSVLEWFRTHPKPGIYLRQLDVPGVDTKFIESRKALLSELLDRILPADAIDVSAIGARSFEIRYGLLAKPVLLRFRVLDDTLRIGGFSDLTVTLEEFAAMSPATKTVFITENDANGLAFPPHERSMVIFGLGYGVESLARIPWLGRLRIVYWGDIDTHGFAILDRLRRHFPHARSLLMDRTTLETHRNLWTSEPTPVREPLERLTPDERALYNDLCEGRLGDNVRLEQERIVYGHVKNALAHLMDVDDP